MKSFKKRFLKKKYGACAKCGATKKLTIDHIIPKSKGGSGRWKNLQVLCKSCNNLKGDKIESYPQHNVAVISEEGKIDILIESNKKNMQSDSDREFQAKKDLENEAAQTGTAAPVEASAVDSAVASAVASAAVASAEVSADAPVGTEAPVDAPVEAPTEAPVDGGQEAVA